jgi:hypothetical protein
MSHHDQLTLFNMPQTTRTSDDYWTPKWIFDALGITFDIDVACPPEGPAHTPCKQFYTQADDGLAQPWHGTVFMNPPFSKPAPWFYKWLQHGNGIAISVASKSKWCDRVWDEAHAIVLLQQNLAFVQGAIPWPIMMSAIGNTATQALHNANIGRVR